MTRVVEVESHHKYVEEDETDANSTSPHGHIQLPDDVESYSFRGPLFFGVSSQLLDLMENLNPMPRVLILNMDHVPLIDSSGEAALRTFLNRCKKKDIFVIFSGVQHNPMKILNRMGVLAGVGADYIFTDTFEEAVEKSRLSVF